MYCLVYGCTSSSKNNSDGQLHFFFHSLMLTTVHKKKAERKHGLSFRPSKYRCICSQHFDSNSYLSSHSPDFLRSISFVGKRKPKLKDDALPTLNMPLNESREQIDTVKIRARGALSRLKVCTDVQKGIK